VERPSQHLTTRIVLQPLKRPINKVTTGLAVVIVVIVVVVVVVVTSASGRFGNLQGKRTLWTRLQSIGTKIF
jgi:hypothetical protein